MLYAMGRLAKHVKGFTIPVEDEIRRCKQLCNIHHRGESFRKRDVEPVGNNISDRQYRRVADRNLLIEATFPTEFCARINNIRERSFDKLINVGWY